MENDKVKAIAEQQWDKLLQRERLINSTFDDRVISMVKFLYVESYLQGFEYAVDLLTKQLGE